MPRWFRQTSGSARFPAARRQFETRKIEARRDRAADERPGAEAFRSLPGAGRHDRLRALASRQIGTKLHALDRASLARRNLECKRRARVVVPDLGGIDAMPMRAFASARRK